MEQVRQVILKRPLPLRWTLMVVVFLLVIGWLLNTPEGILGKADAVGYAVCHRIDLRSFHLGDRPLPLCARCTGMYLGAVVGLVYQAVTARRRAGTPPWPVLAGLVLFTGAFALDGGNSFLALLFGRGLLYSPNNMLRLFTGSGMGLVISAALFPAFNQTIWKDWQEAPALPGLKSFLGLAGFTILVDVLVLTEHPVVLYPFALVSAAGVLVLLTLLYTMVFVMMVRKENMFGRLSELGMALVAGFGVGLLQIVAIDMLRFLVTGTWEGFHFG